LYALIQQRSDPGHRARIIAGNNILNAIFMVASTGTAIVLLSGGVTIAPLFLVTAVLNLLVAICIFSFVPEFLFRFIVWVLVHTAYRAPKADVDRIPSQGPVVLICNDASFLDALVIAGCCWRPTRFVVDQGRIAMPIAGLIFRALDAIPFAQAAEDRHTRDRAFERIASALDAREIVCIFPQTLAAGDREIRPSCPAVERIVQRNPVPVIPIALRGVWRGMFRNDIGSRSRRFLRRPWPRIALIVGEPLAPEQVLMRSHVTPAQSDRPVQDTL
jgi:1-acyl-sn-glycerol-3-phosphate acyltransferase